MKKNANGLRPFVAHQPQSIPSLLTGSGGLFTDRLITKRMMIQTSALVLSSLITRKVITLVKVKPRFHLVSFISRILTIISHTGYP
jgi:hypothetical protein